MVPSELGDWNSKGCTDRNNLYFQGIHPVVKVLGHFVFTGWLAGR